jgi:hypothetical protein
VDLRAGDAVMGDDMTDGNTRAKDAALGAAFCAGAEAMREAAARAIAGMEPGDMGDEEIGALHCLGMCMDWEGHPAYQSADDAGLRQFLIDCAEGLRWQRDEIERQRAEIASLRLTLGGRTFSAAVPEPIGCPVPGACVQVAEIERLRAALRAIRDCEPERHAWSINVARAALGEDGRA